MELISGVWVICTKEHNCPLFGSICFPKWSRGSAAKWSGANYKQPSRMRAWIDQANIMKLKLISPFSTLCFSCSTTLFLGTHSQISFGKTSPLRLREIIRCHPLRKKIYPLVISCPHSSRNPISALITIYFQRRNNISELQIFLKESSFLGLEPNVTHTALLSLHKFSNYRKF